MTKASSMTRRTNGTKRPIAATPPALHSAASPDWGTPMLLKRFAACLLTPAAMGRAIDLDYSTSAYWQQWWPDPADRPHAFLDGSRGKNVLVAADRHNAASRLGTGFFNPPGLGGGEMVQQCWQLFEEEHRIERLGSGVWIGFSLEQLASLQTIAPRNPLSTGSDDLITTIVPSRRARYLLHPKQMIGIMKKKQAKRERGSKQWAAEQRVITRLRKRSDDAPVAGAAPSHASYVTLLWHRDRAVRRSQMEAARRFLAVQAEDPKSLLYRYEAIGPLELELHRS